MIAIVMGITSSGKLADIKWFMIKKKKKKNVSIPWESTPLFQQYNTKLTIHAFLTSRLDYYNALLGGCSARLINKLQNTDGSKCSS